MARHKESYEIKTKDHELILLRNTITYDDLQNPIETVEEYPVLCNPKSITRSEFYNAAIAGMKPTGVFEVSKYDYQNETQVKFEGKTYKVMRTFVVEPEDIELTCEVV